MTENPLKTWLKRTNTFSFTVFVSLVAFSTYTCMYAFRKPFTVATFDDTRFFGIDYKILLVIAQVLGYTLSKFIGIKVISEFSKAKRAWGILIFIALAGLSLVFFALVPPPYNIIFLFLNGLPLGLIWGLVFSYLEGRKVTEILGAGLSTSFIFSSGFVKTAGSYVMHSWGVSPLWMPAVTGSLFMLPLLGFVWALDQVPPPTPEDEKLRTRREPMDRAARRLFLKNFAPGIVVLVVVYILLTAFREFRDNFAAEIWQTLGYGDQPMIFTLTEIPVSILVLIIMSLVIVFKDNHKALAVNQIIILIGMVLLGISTYTFQRGLITAPVWMTLVGFGLYLGYVPYNSILFDRLLAAFRFVGTAGFLIYLADSCGYLGSIVVLLYKNFGQANLSWLNFFIITSYVLSIVGSGFIMLSIFYFKKKRKTWITEKEAMPAGSLQVSEN